MLQELTKEMSTQAVDVLMPRTCADITNVHLIYFLGIKETMLSQGYDSVKIKYPGVDEVLASALADATIQQVAGICSGEVAKVQPSIDAEKIISTLRNVKDAQSMMIMNLLSQVSMRTAEAC